ncbi:MULTISPECIES: helix-turn-helix transcriptional regulator [Paenibacillus]|uniref:Helix-turn-helix transcriptional regulator n=1 Tax=Paenibacillus polymyxa TaxID=1406 RepID=A0AAP3ZZU4_PAEPO|nr:MULTISPECIES: helix-turn-helix transcriptional regulator [Paenibacillus]MDH2332528.1 helix-turn-helix transcriptional regulator [Paenibacillus polymyxa]OMF32375.1 transcriptional regulator [Paenibacillus peoriae]
MSLGQRIKALRKQAKLTQKQIADQLGMGSSNFGHIENDRVTPSSADLQKIADILDTTTDYLLGRTNDFKSDPYYALTDQDERDIAKKLEAMMNDLDSDSSLSFMGEPMDEEDRELLRISLENTLRMSREMAKKKFTPKKYRK